MKLYPSTLAILLVAVLACAALAQNAPQTAQTGGQAGAAPQAPPANPVSTEVKQMYTTIKNNMTKMAEKMPEEHYAFKATADVRTFGELVGHVADAQARTCSMLNGAAKAVNGGQKKTKADLVAALKESFTMCDQAFEGLTDAKAVELVTMGQRQRSRIGALAGVVVHSNEEYGYMAVYMRLKGVVPPSSEGR